MAEDLPRPDDLRAQARRHRDKAQGATDLQARAMHLTVAEEFDKLAAAIEHETRADKRRAQP